MAEKTDFDLVIAGAGPVGLLAAVMLGRRGWRVGVFEKLDQALGHSRAIGISPPSLAALATVDLADPLVRRGVAIRQAWVFGSGRRPLGHVTFDDIPSAFPFMLSIPQTITEAVLTESALAVARIERGVAVTGFTQTDPSRVVVQLEARGERRQISTTMLIDCTGAKSQLLAQAGLAAGAHRYPDTFVMGDFPDQTDFGTAARLFFTPDGAVESFPLPGQQRRWIVQTRAFISEPSSDFLAATVNRRLDAPLISGAPTWQSPFGVQRARAKRYRRGSVFFVGDAAHVMSPIGAQGMNVGFADVAHLAPLIDRALAGQPVTDHVWADWEGRRQRAFRVAADRAWRSMRLGTVRGLIPALIRDQILWLMLNGPTRGRVPIDYTMLTIPS